MIGTLEIQNFKSIKHLKLDCKKINVFIGEPNVGKSNILEALAIFSYGAYSRGTDLRAFVRYERSSNLFYDENLHEAVEITFDNKSLVIVFKDGGFHGEWTKEGARLGRLSGSYETISIATSEKPGELSPFKFYRFAVQGTFPRQESEFLLPPSGINLMSLFLVNKELRATANQLFSPSGLRLGLRPQEGKIEVLKQLEDIVISYPYSLASDTLQRLVFHLSALLTNKDSVIAFEEPEAHAFPYHTKYLAETIALDERNNQFFLSTHNPYLLLPLLEKAPKDGVAIFITYFKDYQTKIKPLTEREMEEVAEIDVFSNLERFLGR